MSDSPTTSISFFNLGDEIAALGRWFHNLHLPDGTQTAPHHPLGDFPAYKWAHLSDVCEPDPEHPATITTWNAEELLSATGADPQRGKQ
jgi:hypothetical protein